MTAEWTTDDILFTLLETTGDVSSFEGPEVPKALRWLRQNDFGRYLVIKTHARSLRISERDLEWLIEKSSPTAEPLDLTSAVLRYPELVQRNIPERSRWLSWLPERSTAMIYGERGVGKTLLGLSAGISLATGTPFLAWEARATDVLYIDGEMPVEDIRSRSLQLTGERRPRGLYLLSSEIYFEQFGHDLHLTDEQTRTAVDAYLAQNPSIHILILDNISSLFTGISEDKKQDWEPINAWLIRLRHRGISTVIMHHAGKSGNQRGTSSREDILDTVISLRRPHDYNPENGCRFILRFEKSRGIAGSEVQDLEVTMSVDGEAWTWLYAPLNETHRDKVIAALRDGETSTRIIAEEVGCTEGYVRRIKRQFEKPE